MNETTLAAPHGIRSRLPVFDAAKDAEDGLIAPTRIAGFLGEIVPVVLVPPRPGHGVDARAAAEHLAHGEREPAAVEQGVGQGLKTPIAFRPEIGGPLTRFPDAWRVIGPTGLEQQYGRVACLSQAARHHRTGRARSADDEIVGWSNLRREPALVGVDASVELGCFRGSFRRHPGPPFAGHDHKGWRAPATQPFQFGGDELRLKRDPRRSLRSAVIDQLNESTRPGHSAERRQSTSPNFYQNNWVAELTSQKIAGCK